MRKFSWMLLLLLAFSVYAEDGKEVVVGSAKELKGVLGHPNKYFLGSPWIWKDNDSQTLGTND